MSDETPAPGGFGTGSRLASYRLDEPVGRGGMATVYRAFDIRLQRRVALKILAPELAGDEEFRQRFIRESRTAAAVDHPNIIPIFEAGEAGGILFIAMRFVDGRDVQTIIDSQGPLPVARACDIVTQVASALDAAHASGLVHRDVKPANMLRDAAAGGAHADHVYLSDFGLSKRSLSSSGLTSKGHFLGTLNYVAPEQIEGRGVDGRSDQYALACSAFEILSGTPPFKQDETLAIMWAQLSTAPPALTARRPGLPAAVDQVMARALAKAPTDRYPTCLEFAATLRRACGLDPGAERSPAAGGRRPTQAVSPAELAAAAAAGQRAQAPPRTPAVEMPGAADPPAAGLAGAGAARAAAGGPPTQAFQQPSGRTSPRTLPEPPAPAGPLPPGYLPPAPEAPRRRRRGWIAAGVAGLVAVAAAGGVLLLARGSGARTAAALVPPACTTKTAHASVLTSVPSTLVTVGGQPFDVVTTGNFGFVSVSNGLAVMNTAGFAPRLIRTIPLPAAQGEALTSDHKYLLVTGGSGVTVFRVKDLEQGGTTPLGSLTSPGGQHAVEVALSPGGTFAFVTLQFSGQLAVFNLQRALTQGFGPSDLVRTIPMGSNPIGVAASTDGRYLYVAGGLASPASSSGQGSLFVLDTHKAETASAKHPILHTVDAGCGPARVFPSADGKNVWVTAGGGNALLGYSAARLINDPGHALIARVAVGQIPLGLVTVNNGTTIVLADSNRDGVTGSGSNLAVVNVQKALAGQPALLGVVKTGMTPRQFALEPGGKTLLVTDTQSGQVQAVNITHLP